MQSFFYVSTLIDRPSIFRSQKQLEAQPLNDLDLTVNDDAQALNDFDFGVEGKDFIVEVLGFVDNTVPILLQLYYKKVKINYLKINAYFLLSM